MLKHWILAIGIAVAVNSKLAAQQNSSSARVAKETITTSPVSDNSNDTVTVFIEQKSGKYAKPVFHPKSAVIVADSTQKIESSSKRQIPKSEK